MTMEETMGAGWAQVIHPDDVVSMTAKWQETVRSGCGHFTYQARYRGRDGKYIYFMVRAQPLRDDEGNVIRWFASMMDVNELMLDRLESDRRTQSFLKLLSHADVSMWSCDQDRHLLLLEGTLCWNMDKPEENKEEAEKEIAKLQALDDLLSGKIESLTIEHQVQDRWFRTRLVADRVPAILSTTALFKTKAVLGLSTDITDIRARGRLEVENEKLTLNEIAAKDASQLKSQFLANVSILPVLFGLC